MSRCHHIIGGEGNLLDEGIVRYLRMAGHRFPVDPKVKFSREGQMGTAADAVRAFMACVPGADAPGSRRLRRCAACSGPIGVARPSALCSDDTRDKREGA